MNAQCCVLIRLHFTFGGDKGCRVFWVLEQSLIHLSSGLSCLACALMFQNPPQILFHLVSLRLALVHTKHPKARRTWPYPCSCACGHFSPNTMLSSCVLSSNFGTQGMLLRFALLNNSLRSTFLQCKVPFGNRTLRFHPKDFVLFRKVDWDFGGSVSWNTQPTCYDFFTMATDPFSSTFLRPFIGLTVNPQCA